MGYDIYIYICFFGVFMGYNDVVIVDAWRCFKDLFLKMGDLQVTNLVSTLNFSQTTWMKKGYPLLEDIQMSH